MHLRLWLWLPGIIVFFIKYGASIASNFDDGDQCFREGGLYYCFGVT
jgi:hypothetical protein